MAHSIKTEADRIYMNGRFYCTDMEGAPKHYEAVAIKDGKFIYIGDNAEAVSFKGDNTDVIELDGKMVIPGLSDAHLHPSMLANQIHSFDLYGLEAEESKSRDDYLNYYLDKISEYVKANPDKGLIRIAGINAYLFIQDGGTYPTKEDLDRICSDRPVIVRSYCMHYGWFNSKALEIAGIDKDTPDVRGGVIIRDADGNPTGFFQEADAINLVIDGIPGGDYSVDEYREAIMSFQNNIAAPFGITMIFDALATPNAREAYRQLVREEKLTLRVRSQEYIKTSYDNSAIDKICESFGKEDEGDDYKVNVVKFFMDGGGLNFYLTEPYERPVLEAAGLPLDYVSKPLWTKAEMENAFLKVSQAGYQIHVHAMGDGGVKHTLDGFEYINRQTGKNGNRNVIAHVMMIREEDKKRFADLEVIASMQPMWGAVETIYEFGYQSSFGKTRPQYFFPLKSLLDEGVVIAFGTDFPIGGMINPYQELQTAMTRAVGKSYPMYEKYKDWKMGPTDNPTRECMSLNEGIAALTIWGAYQHGLENITGSFEVGKSADMVVLSNNLEECDILDYEFTVSEETVFKGRTVFKR